MPGLGKFGNLLRRKRENGKTKEEQPLPSPPTTVSPASPATPTVRPPPGLEWLRRDEHFMEEGRKPLAKGGFGGVYEGWLGDSDNRPQPCIIKKQALVDGRRTAMQRAESRAHRATGRSESRRLVKCYKAWNEDDQFCLALERCDGSLVDLWLEDPYGWDALRCLKAVLQVLEGLEELHKLGWIHADVKPANVLFRRSGSIGNGNGDADDLCLCDFGIARELKGATKIRDGMIGGTPGFQAPELLKGRAYDGKIDVWAAGVLLLGFLSGGYNVFDPTTEKIVRAELLDRVERGVPEPMLAKLSPGVKEVVLQLLENDPEARPTAAAARWIVAMAIQNIEDGHDVQPAASVAHSPAATAATSASLPVSLAVSSLSACETASSLPSLLRSFAPGSKKNALWVPPAALKATAHLPSPPPSGDSDSRSSSSPVPVRRTAPRASALRSSSSEKSIELCPRPRWPQWQMVAPESVLADDQGCCYGCCDRAELVRVPSAGTASSRFIVDPTSEAALYDVDLNWTTKADRVAVIKPVVKAPKSSPWGRFKAAFRRKA